MDFPQFRKDQHPIYCHQYYAKLSESPGWPSLQDGHRGRCRENHQHGNGCRQDVKPNRPIEGTADGGSRHAANFMPINSLAQHVRGRAESIERGRPAGRTTSCAKSGVDRAVKLTTSRPRLIVECIYGSLSLGSGVFRYLPVPKQEVEVVLK
jgi:hypothetical protein